MDLQDPSSKMSTTGGTPLGTVLLTDTPDEIRRKFKVAVTDSGRDIVRGPEKPGISNLIEMMSVATGRSMEEVEQEYSGKGYGQFKSDVAEAVIGLVEPIRQRFNELRSDPGELMRLLALGATKAAATAAPTLDAMYDRMGFTQLPRPGGR